MARRDNAEAAADPAQTPPRRTQRERRALTEERVLDATIGLIAADGVPSVTLAAVGEAAGYSRGIVTHIFGNRQALMAATARELQARLPLESAPGRGLERAVGQVEMYLAAIRDRRRDAEVFVMLWAEALAADPDLRATFVERDRNFRGAIADSLRQGVADGTVREDVEPEVAAVAIVGQLRGIVLQLLATPDVATFEQLREQVVGLVRAGLRSSN